MAGAVQEIVTRCDGCNIPQRLPADARGWVCDTCRTVWVQADCPTCGAAFHLHVGSPNRCPKCASGIVVGPNFAIPLLVKSHETAQACGPSLNDLLRRGLAGSATATSPLPRITEPNIAAHKEPPERASAQPWAGLRPPFRILAGGLVVFFAVAIVIGVTRSHSSPAGQTLSDTPTHALVPVTAGCLAAMQTAAADGHGNDISLERVSTDDDRTITACQSANEWLSAVTNYIGPGDHNVISTDFGTPNPPDVLATICQTTNLVNAPACGGVGS